MPGNVVVVACLLVVVAPFALARLTTTSLTVAQATNVGAGGLVTNNAWFLNALALPVNTNAVIQGISVWLLDSTDCFVGSGSITVRVYFDSMTSCSPTSPCTGAPHLWSTSNGDVTINTGTWQSLSMTTPTFTATGPIRITIVNKNTVCNMLLGQGASNGLVANVTYTLIPAPTATASATATTTTQTSSAPGYIPSTTTPSPPAPTSPTTTSFPWPSPTPGTSPAPASGDSLLGYIRNGFMIGGLYLVAGGVVGAMLYFALSPSTTCNANDSCAGAPIICVYYLAYVIPVSAAYIAVACALALALTPFILAGMCFRLMCPSMRQACDERTQGCCTNPRGPFRRHSAIVVLLFAPVFCPLHARVRRFFGNNCCCCCCCDTDYSNDDADDYLAAPGYVQRVGPAPVAYAPINVPAPLPYNPGAPPPPPFNPAAAAGVSMGGTVHAQPYGSSHYTTGPV